MNDWKKFRWLLVLVALQGGLTAGIALWRAACVALATSVAYELGRKK